MGKFFADLLKNPSGDWDFGRISALHIISVFSFGWLYALIILKKVPDWSNLGIGYGAMCAGAVALIGFKDVAVAKANAITATSASDTARGM